MNRRSRNGRQVDAGRQPAGPSPRARTYIFTVLFESDEDGVVVASVPALPGCFSQGKTHEKATANIKQAIVAYLKSLAKDGEPIPEEPAEEVIGRVRVSLPVPA